MRKGRPAAGPPCSRAAAACAEAGRTPGEVGLHAVGSLFRQRCPSAAAVMDESSLVSTTEGLQLDLVGAGERRRATKKKQRLAALAACTGLLLLVVVIAILVHKSGGGGDGDPPTASAEYAVMLDAGSSGTRAHVYSWPASSSCVTRMKNRQVVERGHGRKIEPGLATLNGTAVEAYLSPLLEFASANVPSAQHATTPIYLQATAGLRLLPNASQHELMAAVVAAFKTSPFRSDASSAKVISGQEEGANEWTTVNYMRRTLGGVGIGPFDSGCFHPTAPPYNISRSQHSAVTLGMGGASTQIAFTPDAKSCPLKDSSSAFCLAFAGDQNWTGLYVHSYLGLGATEAQSKLWEGVAGGNRAANDPCLLSGSTATSEGVMFTGLGNYSACRDSIEAHLVRIDDQCDWPNHNCAFNGVYQPKLTVGDLHLKKDFFELSAFVFTVRRMPPRTHIHTHLHLSLSHSGCLAG